ncbi:MAG: hypothetical protein K2X38_24940 [Gemmataceae bacterium]|nr:hypothetical protein [Gemmataceae bacterium]
MANSQLQWLKDATGDVKAYRAMVVGSQTVLDTLNATVLRFNNHFFNRTEDHREMKTIAAKQTVIASLRELRLIWITGIIA